MIQIDNYLSEDENILWTSVPDKSRAIDKKIYILLLIISVVFIIVGISFFYSIYSKLDNQISNYKEIIFLSLVIVIGFLPMIFTLYKIFAKKKEIKNTRYYITDKSIIIFVFGYKTRFKAIEISKIEKIEIFQYENGYGDIIFENDLYDISFNSKNRYNMRGKSCFKFLGIKDVEYVYNILLELKYKA